MNILITGSTGLVGSALVPALAAKGHHVQRLVRSKTHTPGGKAHWHPESGAIDISALEDLDAVVHLAGENIAGRRWSAAQKQRILDSRVKGTHLLCEALAKLQHKPKVLVCAAAIGYYGERGSEILTEKSAEGTGFLAEVCRRWETAADPARRAGIRVVHLRFGVILSAQGGALAKMLPPFRLGLGGRIGSGAQYMSWIALDDAIGAIQHALANDTIEGPVNAVAPHPVTNLEFTKALGRALHRPVIFPMPAFAARLAFGEMADEILLMSQRVLPEKLLGSDFEFQFPAIAAAFEKETKARTRRKNRSGNGHVLSSTLE
ncbi:TIGR01777 family protein [Candidatus Sumerlaeota bacterium]|nr:TIGR01777 family protein [Candidatus Sumerlaeota bacterium]MBI3734904.1 TIGR01777 family protein [Candidatus Sumerlaeota bacterium]